MEREIRMIDVWNPQEGVEVSVSKEGSGWSIWVNVDGVCRLRAKGVSNLKIESPKEVVHLPVEEDPRR